MSDADVVDVVVLEAAGAVVSNVVCSVVGQTSPILEQPTTSAALGRSQKII